MPASPTGSAARVIVIGSGPVGAAAARRLAERGCATTSIEAGHPVRLRGRPDARPGEHLRNQAEFGVGLRGGLPGIDDALTPPSSFD